MTGADLKILVKGNGVTRTAFTRALGVAESALDSYYKVRTITQEREQLYIDTIKKCRALEREQVQERLKFLQADIISLEELKEKGVERA